jgi:hypothetical protein
MPPARRPGTISARAHPAGHAVSGRPILPARRSPAGPVVIRQHRQQQPRRQAGAGPGARLRRERIHNGQPTAGVLGSLAGMIPREVVLIGVPTDSSGTAEGVARAPGVLRQRGLTAALAGRAGFTDAGISRWPPRGPGAAHPACWSRTR